VRGVKLVSLSTIQRSGQAAAQAEYPIAAISYGPNDAVKIDPFKDPPDPALLDSLDPKVCLEYGILPWRCFGDSTVLLTHDTEVDLTRYRALKSLFGRFNLAYASKAKLDRFIDCGFNDELAFDAETALDDRYSCRRWRRSQTLAFWGAISLCFGVLLSLSYGLAAMVLFGWVIFVLFCSTLLKLSAIFANGLLETPKNVGEAESTLPTFSILVPLFREPDIAAHLIEHLNRLKYAKEKIEVCLIVENDDQTTQIALKKLPLPDWIRVVTVPDGRLRTKPRALNYAMNFAHGAIIGVYDAEDAPDPNQLRAVARIFASSDPSVACVQGCLDYYNASSNWLSRCFTLEYASWFRVVLPGYARMGLLVPLGGTTLFFRRDILRELGNWDAHNVTEDADLGVRLARNGYRTVFMKSVTMEEANARAWPWVKQRSRWLKGYAVTYAVHMRRPIRLMRELGLWRFFGFQILFLGTLSQFVLAPALWSVVVIPFGLPHPLLTILNTSQFLALTGVFLFSAVVNLTASCLGAHRAGKVWLIKWAPTMFLYFPLGTLGAIKGLAELAWKPFYWDKTVHGIDVPR